MKHETRSNGGWRRPGSTVSLMCVILVAAAILLLLIGHRAHVFGALPYLLILACPLTHLFMHRGHGRRRGGQDGAGRDGAPR